MLLAAFIAAGALGQSLLHWRNSNAPDFYQFWLVGQASSTPAALTIYTDEARHELGAEGLSLALQSGTEAHRQVARRRLVLETYATPFLFTLFSLFSDDYERAYAVFLILSAAALVAAFLALGLSAGHDLRSTFLLLAATVLFFEAYLSDAKVGNVNQLQIGGLALLVWLRRGEPSAIGELISGALLGLLLAFKPNLAPSALLLAVPSLRDRRFAQLGRALLGGLAGVAAAMLVSSVHFGSPGIWTTWFSALRELERLQWPMSDGNTALSGFFPGIGSGTRALIALSSIAMFGAALWRSRIPRLDREVLALGLGIAASLLSAGLAWIHYYLLLTLLIVWLLRPAATRLAQGLTLLAMILFAVTPLAITPLGVFASPSGAFIATQMVLGLLILCVAAVSELSRGAPAALQT
jgi:hypothetical protein